MMRKYVKLIILLNLICIISGCSKSLIKEKHYVIPVNYSGEATVKIYTDKTENTYAVKIVCKDGNYSFIVNDGSANWNITMDGGACTLNNDKFKDNNVTINNFKIADSLIDEFNLGKFNNLQDNMPDELIYWDGTYKHVLNFSKENLLPENIFIYKNDVLVKTIQYDKLKMEL